jgi:hypothetical protein
MLLETPSWSLWESYPPLFGFRVLCLLCLFLGTYSTEFPAWVPSQSWTHSHPIHTREGWLSMNLLVVRPTVFSFPEKFRQFVFKLRKQWFLGFSIAISWLKNHYKRTGFYSTFPYEANKCRRIPRFYIIINYLYENLAKPLSYTIITFGYITKLFLKTLVRRLAQNGKPPACKIGGRICAIS